MASPRTRRVLQELKPHDENNVSKKIILFHIISYRDNKFVSEML